MNHLSAKFHFQNVNDEGHFTGIAAVYDTVATARELDVIRQGGFKRTVDHWKSSGKRVPFLFSHDDQQVLGSMLVDESKRGLEITDGRFDLSTQIGKEKHSLVKNGHVDGLSIGFLDIPSKTEHVKTDRGVIRFMGEVKLFEVSLVTFPADEGARIETVHSGSESIMGQIVPVAQNIIAIATGKGEAAEDESSPLDISEDINEFFEIVSLANSIIELASSPVMDTAPAEIVQKVSEKLQVHVNKLEALLKKHQTPVPEKSTQDKSETTATDPQHGITAVKEMQEMHDALTFMFKNRN